MVRQRPRRALQTPWRTRLAIPSVIAGLAATGLVVVNTSTTDAAQSTSPVLIAAAPVAAVPPAASAAPVQERKQSTSRNGSDSRPALPKAAKSSKPVLGSLPKVKLPSLKVVDTEYTRVALNVREDADADSDLITVLTSGSKVAVTATVRGAWQYVVYRGDGGWVKKQYLVESKPKPKPKPEAKSSTASGGGSKASAGRSSGACAGGSAVESGLTPDAVRVHRAICSRFPAVTSYGGVRADSLPEHPSGRALDAMVSSHSLGLQIADWVRANARQLGVSEVIFAQRIWTVQRGSEGWRSMSDRGSPSANHADHVHVTVYGSSGG